MVKPTTVGDRVSGFLSDPTTSVGISRACAAGLTTNSTVTSTLLSSPFLAGTLNTAVGPMGTISIVSSSTEDRPSRATTWLSHPRLQDTAIPCQIRSRVVTSHSKCWTLARKRWVVPYHNTIGNTQQTHRRAHSTEGGNDQRQATNLPHSVPHSNCKRVVLALQQLGRLKREDQTPESRAYKDRQRQVPPPQRQAAGHSLAHPQSPQTHSKPDPYGAQLHIGPHIERSTSPSPSPKTDSHYTPHTQSYPLRMQYAR